MGESNSPDFDFDRLEHELRSDNRERANHLQMKFFAWTGAAMFQGAAVGWSGIEAVVYDNFEPAKIAIATTMAALSCQRIRHYAREMSEHPVI